MNVSALSKTLVGLAASSLLAAAAHAASYPQMYVFGDSLSDIGNLRAVTQNPGIPERFSNGAVAVEVLAAYQGLTLKPSFHLLPLSVTGGKFGNNYAVAGAVAIDEDGNPATADINLPTQVNAFLTINGNKAPSDALYVVMIGGNDIFAAQKIIGFGKLGSAIEADKRIKKATDSVKAELTKLVATGARNILVVNAPDVGATPSTDLTAAQVAAQAKNVRDTIVANTLEDITRVLSISYNARLHRAVTDVEKATGVDIQEFNLFGFFDETIANAKSLGYTNWTEACVYALTGGGFNPSCNFNTFMFFDEIHPTAYTHQRAGAAVAAQLK